jgi:hypothetical protein
MSFWNKIFAYKKKGIDYDIEMVEHYLKKAKIKIDELTDMLIEYQLVIKRLESENKNAK